MKFLNKFLLFAILVLLASCQEEALVDEDTQLLSRDSDVELVTSVEFPCDRSPVSVDDLEAELNRLLFDCAEPEEPELCDGEMVYGEFPNIKKSISICPKDEVSVHVQDVYLSVIEYFTEQFKMQNNVPCDNLFYTVTVTPRPNSHCYDLTMTYTGFYCCMNVPCC